MNVFRSAMKAGLERGKALFKGITNGDFTVNEAREEIATVVREARASGKSPKDIVAMLKDNHQLRQMAEVVFGGLNEFDWQHKVETLKNSSESSVWDHASIGSVEDLVEKLNLDRKVADLRWNMIPSGTQDILRPHLHKLTKGKENSDTDFNNEVSKVFKCNRCGSPIETTRSGHFCSKCEDFIPDNEVTDTRKNLHDGGPLEAITEGVENAKYICPRCHNPVAKEKSGDSELWCPRCEIYLTKEESKERGGAEDEYSHNNDGTPKACELCKEPSVLSARQDVEGNVWYVCSKCAKDPQSGMQRMNEGGAEYPHDIFNTKNPGLKRGASKYGVDPDKKGE